MAPGSCFPWLSRLYLGDGRGGFVERGCGGVRDWLPPFAADLDGDGDLDLAGPNGIFWNLTRQACAPFLARLGHGYRLDFYARSPAATRARPVLPLVGLSRRRTPLGSLGTLGLDPARPLFLLPPIATDPVSGMAALAFPIPADPALSGAELHFQALVAEGAAGPWRLTNVVSDTVFSL